MTGLTHSVAHALRAGNKSWFYETINYEEKEHFLKFLLQVIDDLSSSIDLLGLTKYRSFTHVH